MMSDYLWVWLALLAALSGAATRLIFEGSGYSIRLLIFWMRVIGAIALLPVAVMLEWPGSWIFYAGAGITALTVCWTDFVVFGATRAKGAGVTSRIDPLVHVTTFFAWTALNPWLLYAYAGKPLQTAGIITAMAGIGYFTLRLKNCALSRATLKMLWPVILAGAVATISAKYAMDHAGAEGPFIYTFLQFCTFVIVYAIWLARHPEEGAARLWPGGRLLAVAACITLASFGHIIPKNFAFQMVVNPAYVTVLTLTTPLWIGLYDRIRLREGVGDVVSGLGIVACVVLLVLMA